MKSLTHRARATVVAAMLALTVVVGAAGAAGAAVPNTGPCPHLVGHGGNPCGKPLGRCCH
jgi:hypothetical protein